MHLLVLGVTAKMLRNTWKMTHHTIENADHFLSFQALIYLAYPTEVLFCLFNLSKYSETLLRPTQ
jgi:hypothetical protein